MKTYDATAVAEMFAVAPNKVFAWIGSGELEAVNVASSGASRPRWRITEEALQRFMKLRQSVPPAPPVALRKQMPNRMRFV